MNDSQISKSTIEIINYISILSVLMSKYVECMHCVKVDNKTHKHLLAMLNCFNQESEAMILISYSDNPIIKMALEKTIKSMKNHAHEKINTKCDGNFKTCKKARSDNFSFMKKTGKNTFNKIVKTSNTQVH